MSISISGSGAITGASTSYSFDQAVSIAGTVTYEDVSNVDSVGVITAQSGIHLDDSIIHLGDTDTKIRFPAANTITAETAGSERLRVGSDGNCSIGTTTNTNKLRVHQGSDSANIILATGADESSEFISLGIDSGVPTLTAGGVTSTSADLAFRTADNGTESEKVRITSAGKLILKPGADSGNILQLNGADTTSEILEAGITSGHVQFTATHASGGSNTCGFIFRTRGGAGGTNEKVRISSDGKVGIGSDNPDAFLVVQGDSNASTNPSIRLKDGSDTREVSITNTSGDFVVFTHGIDNNAHGQIKIFESGIIDFGTGGSGGSIATRLRIDTDGKFGFNTINPPRDFCFHSGEADTNIQITNNTTGVDDSAGSLIQQDGNDFYIWNKENSFMSLGTNGTQRVRIDNSGNALFNTSTNGTTAKGIVLRASGELLISREAGPPLLVNRLTNDGSLVDFRGQNSSEGSINVSGSDVTLAGATLSRWSQLPGNAERIEILRGTVLSNLDEMCEWGDEDNEQLNRIKVSDVEGDVNVAGVFRCWDDDDDTYINDFYCAMTGDFVIRIAQGVTVARGDLLMSAGDGTAKPQGDGYIQDKTIAKVTSTTVSATYSDGSYCVPCVLMAC